MFTKQEVNEVLDKTRETDDFIVFMLQWELRLF